MRLLFFLPFLSTKGGQERTLVDKANWLVERGHEVFFVTYENVGSVAYPLDERIHYTDIDCRHFTVYHVRLWRRWRAVLAMKRQFRERLSAVISDFRPDLIVATIPLTEFFLYDLLQEADTVPVVIESHLARGHEAVARGFTEKVLDVFYSPLRAIHRADLLIALTEGDARQWQNVCPRVCVIPNPVTSYPTSVAHVAKDTGHIIAVGRLSPQKRFDRLVDAFALIAHRHLNWQVDIYGSGQENVLRAFEQYIDSRNLSERISLHHPVDNIYQKYCQSEFLVVSSDFEGFGLVIVEAMACGIPIVSTDCPFGPSEIIEDGKTGLLAKMDAMDLAAKMEWMITHDKERKQMGLSAYQAAARYRKEVIMPQWEQAYLSVIK